MPWPGLVQPYVKNKELGICPDMTDSLPKSGNNRSLLYCSYGLNYGYLGTYAGGDPIGTDYIWTPLSMAAVNRPANTVFITDTQAPNYANADHTSVWANATLCNTVDPPDAYLSDKVFWGGGWGTGCSDQNITANYDFPCYGGVDFRHAGMKKGQPNVMPDGGASTVFVDGHAKFYRVGGLAAGTNYRPNQPGTQVYQVNKDAYLWDPRN
jgi:hypothetical protein